MAPQYNFEIGLTRGAMTNIESLTVSVRAPKSTFRPYAEQRDLTSLKTRGLGLPVATWTWALLPQNERDQLRTFCTGASAAVHIRTRTIDSADSYKYYACAMIWPTQNEELDFLRRMNFAIEFRALVEEA